MPSTAYTMPLSVRLYDLDLRDEVSSATLLRYFEETAIEASAHLGFTFDWYRERGQFWVIRTMRLERSAPAHYQDQLEISTWVSTMSRVRADRNYVARRAQDGRVLARATANWVYLDMKTMYPARIAPDIVEIFKNSNPNVLPPRPMAHWATLQEDTLQHSTVRRAQYYEADSARHTNNAIYLDWFEEAVRDTLLAHGYALPLDEAPSLSFYRHSVEYLNAARPGDEVEITTRLVGRGQSAGYWEQDIRRVASGERVAHDECVTLWRGASNQIISWPHAGAMHSHE